MPATHGRAGFLNPFVLLHGIWWFPNRQLRFLSVYYEPVTLSPGRYGLIISHQSFSSSGEKDIEYYSQKPPNLKPSFFPIVFRYLSSFKTPASVFLNGSRLLKKTAGQKRWTIALQLLLLSQIPSFWQFSKTIKVAIWKKLFPLNFQLRCEKTARR